MDERITALSVGIRISFDVVSVDVLPAMTERGTLPVHTAVILARYLELWTVLRLMTAVV